MNIRKEMDYSTMFAALEAVMEADMPQMELYRRIGEIICKRTEKGAAVAAAKYLAEKHPEMTGFSRAIYAGCGISGGCTAIRRNFWRK